MFYFHGYCPECQLQGKDVSMVLNEDDFYECPQCRLQVVVSPAVATILRWRGKGQFRREEQLATETCTDLALAEGGKEEGHELQPDTENLLQDKLSLEWFLHEISDKKEAFEAHLFHAKDPVLEAQRQRLATIKPEQWQLLFETFELFSNAGIRFNIRKAPAFRIFEQYLKQFGVLFDFKWQAWHQGWLNIRNIRFPYSKASLLELSMYISAIFLSEPYDEGTVEFYFNNKTLEKILKAMEERVKG